MNTAAITLLERLFALRQVQPFDRLPADELALLAEVARAHRYAAGEAIHPGGAPLARLLVITGGGAVWPDGGAAGPIAGVAALLRRTDTPTLTAAAGGGALVLDIGRHHFFTLAHECPEFVLGLLELGEAGARGGSL